MDVDVFRSRIPALLEKLEKSQLVPSKTEGTQRHGVSKTGVRGIREISQWVEHNGLQHAVRSEIESLSRQDADGILTYAQIAERLLDSLERINLVMPKRSTMIWWVVFVPGARIDRGIRLERGLIRDLHRDLSRRKTNLGKIGSEPQLGAAEPEKAKAKEARDSERRSSNDPWARLRVLTLGGTFFEALSDLYVLARLMDHVAEEELSSDPKAESSSSSPLYSPIQPLNNDQKYNFRPCHYFDHICGSGFSGISAVMLGTMRFSVPEAIPMMHAILRAAVPAPKRTHTHAHPRPEDLMDVLEQTLTGSRGTSEDSSKGHKSSSMQPATLKANSDMCQTSCVVALKSENEKSDYSTLLLRSYERGSTPYASHEPESISRTYVDKLSEQPIASACILLVASQFHRKWTGPDHKGAGEKFKVKDTRRLDINPAWEAYKEASDLCSDGTGSLQFLCSIDSAASTPNEKVMHVAQSRYYEQLGHLMPGSFWLFETETPSLVSHAYEGLETLIKSIESGAKSYCEKNKTLLQRCAKVLVHARRVRAQTMRWSKFAGLNVTRGRPVPDRNVD
jgi:hypothetical protein